MEALGKYLDIIDKTMALHSKTIGDLVKIITALDKRLEIIEGELKKVKKVTEEE